MTLSLYKLYFIILSIMKYNYIPNIDIEYAMSMKNYELSPHSKIENRLTNIIYTLKDINLGEKYLLIFLYDFISQQKFMKIFPWNQIFLSKCLWISKSKISKMIKKFSNIGLISYDKKKKIIELNINKLENYENINIFSKKELDLKRVEMAQINKLLSDTINNNTDKIANSKVTNTKYIQKKILKNINIEFLLSDKNIDFNIEGKYCKISCPFHNDNKPSCAINLDSLQYNFYCFWCEKKWDIFNILEKIENKWFKEILNDLHNNYYKKNLEYKWYYKKNNFNNNDNKSNKINKKSNEEYEILNFICDYFSKNIPNEIYDKYLLKKDFFSYETYWWKINMNWYWFTKKLISDYKIWYSNNDSKLYNLLINKFWEKTIQKYLKDWKYFWIIDKIKKPIFKNMIIFPIIINWKIESFIWRQTEKTPNDKYNTAKYKFCNWNIIFLYNQDDLNDNFNNIVIITEWVTDCLKLKQYNHNAISILWTSINNYLQKILIKKLKDKKILIILDNDLNNSWNNWAKKIQTLFDKNNIKSKIVTLPLISGKKKIDINEYINQNWIEKFNKLLWKYNIL